MKNFIKKTFAVIIAFFTSLTYTSISHAVEVEEFLKDKLPKVNSDIKWGEAIAKIIEYLIWIVAILAIIAITWSAIMMFLSVGDEQKFNKAKKILIMSLIGVGVAGGGYAMVNIISSLSLSI